MEKLDMNTTEKLRDLLAELETINSLACYATEANTSARLDALLEIGKRARAAIAKAETT